MRPADGAAFFGVGAAAGVWYNRLRMDTRKTPAARALVTASYSGYYIFERSGDGATGVARLKRGAFRSRDPLSVPVAGDFVELEPNPAGESRILSVCPRKTAFIRRDPSGSGRRAQVLAANFDYVFIFAGCDRPFAPGRLERAFALSRQSGAEAVVVLSKADLADARELEELAECARRAAPGAAVVPLSSKTGAGVETLRALLAPGRVAVLLGESGAGKSTLLNALAGKRVADISNGAVAVLGNAFDHQRDALGPVAFIHDLFKNCTVFGFTGTALDSAIDAVFWHVVGTCLINGQT